MSADARRCFLPSICINLLFILTRYFFHAPKETTATITLSSRKQHKTMFDVNILARSFVSCQRPMHYRIGLLRALSILFCASLMLACTAQPQREEAAHSAPLSESFQHHTVALLGATGMVGGYLLEDALRRGYTVRALARNPAKLAQFASRITIITGDARDPAVIRELLQGSDAVISALGPVKADGDASRFINTTVTRNVLEAMPAADISLYIAVSGAGVVMPDDDRNLLGWWIRTLAQIGLRSALEDKQAEYDLLADSDVNWTLVRCPLIDPEPFDSPPLVSLKTTPAFQVRAGEVAQFMMEQLDARDFIRQGPFLGSRDLGI
jgi:putative NADH-flavin reductase